MTNKDIGNELKRLRLAKKMSAYRLAKITGLSQQQIGQIERGKPITMETFNKYLNAVDGQLIIKGV